MAGWDSRLCKTRLTPPAAISWNITSSKCSRPSATAGERLLDVLDVHFYTSTPDDPADIVQAPRSLWDPTYMENSWIAQSIPGPIELLPRLQSDINQYDPGTKLSISEYNYGGGDEIAGAIAEADALGIFGVQGVYAAAEWQLLSNESYIAAAFNMYRDFDGNNGTFGDTSVFASTNDVTDSSIYASVDSSSTNVMTLVAINKSTQSLTANIQLDHVQPGATAAIYQLTGASTTPQFVGHGHDFQPGQLHVHDARLESHDDSYYLFRGAGSAPDRGQPRTGVALDGLRRQHRAWRPGRRLRRSGQSHIHLDHDRGSGAGDLFQ